MINPDDYLKEYILDRFYEEYPSASAGAVVKTADVGWDCYCYSEYTRNDYIEATAVVIGANGRAFTLSYSYDLPQMIQDMAGEQDNCSVEDYDDD